MYLAQSINERVLSYLFFSPKRMRLEEQSSSPLQHLCFDAWLGVISFLDGSSKCHLGLANRKFFQTMHNAHNWRDCTIDFSVLSLGYAMLLLQEYGSFISTLRLRGTLSACAVEHMLRAIAEYCPKLRYFDSFPSLCRIPWSDSLCAFSLPFPSAASDYLTAGIRNQDHLLYTAGDCIHQTVLSHVSLSDVAYSVWQFEVDNAMQPGFSVVLECCINGCAVGHVTLKDSTVADTYAVNMLFPVSPCVLQGNPRIMALSLVLKTSLPFGAGSIRVSSLGRISLLKSDEDLHLLDPSVPEFSD